MSIFQANTTHLPEEPENNPDNKASGILTYDGNHFNDAGHVFVAEQMMGKFEAPK